MSTCIQERPAKDYIKEFVSTSKNAEQAAVMIGSDQHLDIILQLKHCIDDVTKATSDVNEMLEQTFNVLTPDQAKEAVLALLDGLRNCRHFILSVRNLHPAITAGCKKSLSALNEEKNQVDEFVQDMIKYKLNDSKELRDILDSCK